MHCMSEPERLRRQEVALRLGVRGQEERRERFVRDATPCPEALVQYTLHDTSTTTSAVRARDNHGSYPRNDSLCRHSTCECYGSAQ